MIDLETAGTMRLVGLLGVGISISVWVLAERSGCRKTLVPLSAGAALLSAVINFLEVMVAADSGVSRFLPRFP